MMYSGTNVPFYYNRAIYVCVGVTSIGFTSVLFGLSYHFLLLWFVCMAMHFNNMMSRCTVSVTMCIFFLSIM